METKSRYEVTADLEGKKRNLIRERDGLDFDVTDKEKTVLELERRKEDQVIVKQDFELKQSKAIQELDREKIEFEFRMKNGELGLDREIVDAKKDVADFKTTMEQRKDTITDLIASVDKSLERIGTLQK